MCVCGSGNWSWIGLYHRLESIQFCMIFSSKFHKDGACIRKSVAGCRNKGAKERINIYTFLCGCTFVQSISGMQTNKYILWWRYVNIYVSVKWHTKAEIKKINNKKPASMQNVSISDALFNIYFGILKEWISLHKQTKFIFFFAIDKMNGENMIFSGNGSNIRSIRKYVFSHWI